MTKILAIEGTGIRDRVLYCQDCRMINLMEGGYYCRAQERLLDTAEIERHHALDFYVDPRCPLPEAEE